MNVFMYVCIHICVCMHVNIYLCTYVHASVSSDVGTYEESNQF